MMQHESDSYWLSQALALARQAASENEVPIGAVVVVNNQLIGKGYNQPIKTHDPTAHAEILALRHAAATINNYRLVDTTLYTTLEPCAMCAGALLHARIKRLVFGAFDSKAGFVKHNSQLLDVKTNHQVIWEGGMLEQDCLAILQQFFRVRR